MGYRLTLLLQSAATMPTDPNTLQDEEHRAGIILGARLALVVGGIGFVVAIVYAVGLGLSIMFAAAVAYLIVEEFETRRPPK